MNLAQGHKSGWNMTGGLVAFGLAAMMGCNAGETPTGQVSGGGSAGLQGPMAFVNNTGDRTLTSVALRGDSGNGVINTLPSSVFGNVALSDMQFSLGEWVFVNLPAANQVATIDPLTAATPVHEVNLNTGTRPVHIYRDPTDGELIWSMNDGDNAPGTTTPGDDLINCNNPARPGGPVEGGSVTVIRNSHLGPGATPPSVQRTICVLADGHKVTAFSSGAGVPKRAFVSSETAGEIAVIDNEPTSPERWTVIARIDLCDSAKEAPQTTPAVCNPEDPTGTTMFTPNNARPHGIRWSRLTNKVYSLQEGYREIVEIDPSPAVPAVVRRFDLAGTPYTSFGITPDGRVLLLRGQTTAPQATKLGVLDVSVDPPVRTDFSDADLGNALVGTTPGSFKFSPDGRRFYILAGSGAAATKRDRLFAFDSSSLTSSPPRLTLLRDIGLLSTVTGGHSFDVLAQGAGEARYIVVSNSSDNSVSVINASDNLIKQTIPVGTTPGAVMVYAPGTAAAGNQATSSLTGGGSASAMPALVERLDDHGMPE